MGNYYAGMINNTGGYGELKHHGILGQKWGIRRFQNADGSLTAAGRERYYGEGEEKHYRNERHYDKDTAYSHSKRAPDTDAETAGLNALRSIGDIHNKVTRDMPGGGSARELRDKLVKNSKTKNEKDKVYQDEIKLIRIVGKWAMDEESNNAEGKMNDYYDKHNIGGLFVSKAKKQEYERLRENYREANSRAWYNMANEVYAFINTLPKGQRDIWFAIAYKNMGLDW